MNGTPEQKAKTMINKDAIAKFVSRQEPLGRGFEKALDGVVYEPSVPHNLNNKINELDWKTIKTGDGYIQHINGIGFGGAILYQIFLVDNGWSLKFLPTHLPTEIGIWPKIAVAKERGQNDYETRLNSCSSVSEKNEPTTVWSTDMEAAKQLDEDVLVITQQAGLNLQVLLVAHYSGSNGWRDANSFMCINTPTHWQPLPKGPEVKS